MADEDIIRIYARDVGLEPEIAGARTVQDCLSIGGGPVQLGNSQADKVRSDAPVALTADGVLHQVTWLVAAPPVWADNAGNLIRTGMYWIVAEVDATAQATTPGLYISVASPFYNTYFVPADAIGSIGTFGITDVQSLGAGDLPFPVTAQIKMPTDATLTVNVRMVVDWLAWSPG